MAGGWDRRPPRFERRPGIVEGLRGATGGRALPMLMTLVGFGVVIVTQAAQRGLITGIAVEWPAYIVGGVLILIGIRGLRGADPDDPPEQGPIRESGYGPRDLVEDDDGPLPPRPGRPGSGIRGK